MSTLLQAATLAAVVIEQDDASLRESLKEAPAKLRSAARTRRLALLKLLQAHPQTSEQLELALKGN